MAITKKQKDELVAQYQDWLTKSRAVFLAEYLGLSMKEMEELRGKIREVGGEFHVIKNTLARIALENAGYPSSDQYFEGSTAAGFAFQDAPKIAKTMADFAKSAESLKIKGGFLDAQQVTPQQIIALAELPPLPVMRAQLLATLMAPASKLARTLAEPARQLASVIKAYADKEAAPANA